MDFEDVMMGAGYRVSDRDTVSLVTLKANHSLPNPGKSAEDRNDNENIRDDTSSNHRRVLHLPGPDDVDNLINEPACSRQCAAGMDPADVLQHRGDRILEPVWSPLLTW
jgi:hypothetical protein